MELSKDEYLIYEKLCEKGEKYYFTSFEILTIIQNFSNETDKTWNRINKSNIFLHRMRSDTLEIQYKINTENPFYIKYKRNKQLEKIRKMLDD
jgi:hypothetical protein